ncbi:hypothetical protein LCGC14_1157160, partial [marine sediment metagenome]
MYKYIIILFMFLSSCMTYAERYQRADMKHQAETIRLDNMLIETETQRARRILDKRSQFVKHYMRFVLEPPLVDEWIRRPEILEKGEGDCDTA